MVVKRGRVTRAQRLKPREHRRQFHANGIGKNIYLLTAKARLGAHMVFYVRRTDYPHAWLLSVRHAGPRVRKPKRFNVRDYVALDEHYITGSQFLAFKLEAARLAKLLAKPGQARPKKKGRALA